jgi:hypothetical protein
MDVMDHIVISFLFYFEVISYQRDDFVIIKFKSFLLIKIHFIIIGFSFG